MSIRLTQRQYQTPDRELARQLQERDRELLSAFSFTVNLAESNRIWWYESADALRSTKAISGRIFGTTAYSEAGDNGGGIWVVKSGAQPGTYVDNGGTILVPKGGNGSTAFVRSYTGDVHVEWFGARAFTETVVASMTSAAAESRALANTSAVAAAVAYVGGIGGGTVAFSFGCYLMTNSNPNSDSWDNDVAIWVQQNDVHIVGVGVGGTIIKLIDEADANLIKFGRRAGATVTVSRCSVRHLSLDGNRANQTAPSESTDHWSGIDVASGCSEIVLEDLHISECQYYGIGFQITGHKNCRVRNVVTENTGADGLDWKNHDSDGRGNVIDGLVVRNYGLGSGDLVNPQAGIDLRSGVVASKLLVEGLAAGVDLHGVRVLADDTSPAVKPPSPTQINGFTVVGAGGTDGANSTGLYVDALGTHVTDGNISGCGDGAHVKRGDCRLTSIDIHDNEASGVLLEDANACVLTGLMLRDNATGATLDNSDEASFLGCDVRSNDLGYDIQSGSDFTKIIGGSLVSNTTQLTNSGNNTFVRSVSGFATKRVNTASVAIDSTGTKTFTIAHNLPLTPNVADVQLTLRRSTNVGDWSVGFLWVTSVDATNVSGAIRILTASATAGATITVQATVETLDGR